MIRVSGRAFKAIMTYFPDLTPHTYVRSNSERTVLNVGWLDEGHEFPKGATSPNFRSRLKELCQEPIYLHRGFHECQFCSATSLVSPPLAERRGSGQIRVASGGRCYAAPTLIWHYVDVHAYSPPAEFIDAVLAGTVVGEE